MKSTVLVLFYASMTIAACCTARNGQKNLPVQGVKGYVTEVTGNRMPSPDQKLSPPKPLQTIVYIYEATSISQVEKIGSSSFYKTILTKFIKSVETDDKGYYQTDLPTGNYSLFTKVDGNFYANSFDQNNIINPVAVKSKEVTEVNITVSAHASF